MFEIDRPQNGPHLRARDLRASVRQTNHEVSWVAGLAIIRLKNRIPIVEIDCSETEMLEVIDKAAIRGPSALGVPTLSNFENDRKTRPIVLREVILDEL